MNEAIEALLTGHGGAIAREDALRAVSRHTLDNEVKGGWLVAAFPRAYCRPWDIDDERIRWRGALCSVGGDVALSHLTTLRCWDLAGPPDQPIHVKAYQPRHPRGVPDQLVVHRTLLPLRPQLVEDLPTVPLEVALVDSWPLLAGTDQRAPMIEAARRRLIRPNRLADALEKMYWVRDIGAAKWLGGLVLGGCESELELYGYTEVFDVAQLRDARRQLSVRVGARSYRLDLAFEAERLDVELDGRKYHSGERREHDIKRDRIIARKGWQTVRYSHDQLHSDPIACREEVIEIRAQRRSMLRIA